MNCHYTNATSSYQIIVLLGRGWEKILEANQSINFWADPNDLLEIREACNPFFLIADRIPCIQLAINQA